MRNPEPPTTLSFKAVCALFASTPHATDTDTDTHTHRPLNQPPSITYILPLLHIKYILYYILNIYIYTIQDIRMPLNALSLLIPYLFERTWRRDCEMLTCMSIAPPIHTHQPTHPPTPPTQYTHTQHTHRYRVYELEKSYADVC